MAEYKILQGPQITNPGDGDYSLWMNYDWPKKISSISIHQENPKLPLHGVLKFWLGTEFQAVLDLETAERMFFETAGISFLYMEATGLDPKDQFTIILATD